MLYVCNTELKAGMHIVFPVRHVGVGQTKKQECTDTMRECEARMTSVHAPSRMLGFHAVALRCEIIQSSSKTIPKSRIMR